VHNHSEAIARKVIAMHVTAWPVDVMLIESAWVPIDLAEFR
jgi:hypothetical protein